MSAPDAPFVRTPPLTLDPDGVMRVGGTRVRLETVVGAFVQGCTAEEIMQKYPALDLPDIYAVITYYLQQRETVEAYLDARRRLSEETERELEARFSLGRGPRAAAGPAESGPLMPAIRFLIDEDLDYDIARGVLRRLRTVDMVRVQDVGLSGRHDDEEVLEWAA